MKNLYKIEKELFITNDESIKVGDYITHGYKVWKWKDDSSLLGRKKVILTNNKDLIADGVQAIDDEFLEWFENNPSCEFIETKAVEFEVDGSANHSTYYEIIYKKTAVEWLFEQLPEHLKLTRNRFDMLNQAKEIEKQQIIDAWVDGNRQEFYDGTETNGEQYYNQEFKK